jgi:hypothetical protein
LQAGEPVEFAGRWAYPLTLEPKDKNLTLVERAEALVDAEAFVPLSFRLYAEDIPEPVVRYEARNFEVGPVPTSASSSKRRPVPQSSRWKSTATVRSEAQKVGRTESLRGSRRSPRLRRLSTSRLDSSPTPPAAGS